MVSDGLGDRPIPQLEGQTPLESARTPTLDELADKGVTGLIHVIAPGVRPGSDAGHLALFGYNPLECYMGRGPFEALGVGLDLQPDDVAFRGNFATCRRRPDGTFQILDRRAGRRLPEGGQLAKLLDGLHPSSAPDVEVTVKHSLEHRCVVVLHGPGLSPRVGDTDPHGEGDTLLKSTPLEDTESARRTAEIVNALTEEFYRILSGSPVNEKRRRAGLPEANVVILRGAGSLPQIPPLSEIYGIRAACVAGGALYRGVAKSVGMDVLDVPGATASYDTDIEAKAKAAAQALERHDYVFLHFKATDTASHDRNPARKVEMIEKMDRLVSMLLDSIDREQTYIAVTADHSTACSTGGHVGDPVPLLISGPEVRRDDVTSFTEPACAKGGLGHLRGTDLMPILMNYLNRTRLLGA